MATVGPVVHRMYGDATHDSLIQRYCVDIISQIKAVVGALEKVQMGVLEKHVHHCVRESVESKSPENFEEKVEELVRVLARMG